MKILLTDNVPEFFEAGLNERTFEPVYRIGISHLELINEISEYEAVVIRSNTILNKDVLNNASKLKYILRPGSGLENVDLDLAGEKGIEVISSPEGNRNAVAEHALGLLLNILNNICLSHNEVVDGIWKREENRGRELSSLKVGIIGYGNTGKAFATKINSLCKQVLVYDKYKSGFGNEMVKEVALEDLYQESDVLSVHLPLNRETKYLLNSNFLTRFNKKIVLINTSRGGILRTLDLIELLNDGKILAAGLDVLEDENLSNYHLEAQIVFKNLIATKKVLLTPHVAGWSHESGVYLYKVLLNKLDALIIR